MKIDRAAEYLAGAIALSEEYLRVPDTPRRPVGGDTAIAAAAQHRLAFLEGFGTPSGFDLRQGRLAEAGAKLLESPLEPRHAIHVEYELSFFGINPQLGERFRPTGLDRLSAPETKNLPIEHVRWAADSIITWDCLPQKEMAEREMPRRIYSIGKYLQTTDLNEIGWTSPEVYSELKEELEPFLAGKSRILEVGFLHQRMKDVIHSIDSQIEYHGVDISIPAVQQARAKGITASNANAWYTIPYPDRYFDGIISTTVQAAGLFPNIEWLRVLNDPRGIFSASLQ